MMITDAFKETIKHYKPGTIYSATLQAAFIDFVDKLASDRDTYITVIPDKLMISTIKTEKYGSLVEDSNGVLWSLTEEGLLITEAVGLLEKDTNLLDNFINMVKNGGTLFTFNFTLPNTSEPTKVSVEFGLKEISQISVGSDDEVVNLNDMVEKFTHSILEMFQETPPELPKPETVIKVNNKTEGVIDCIVKQMKPLFTIVDIASLSMSELIESGYWLKVAVTRAYKEEYGLSSDILILKRGNNGGYGFTNEGSDYFIWMDIAINGKKVTLTIPISSILSTEFLYEGVYQVGDISSVVSHVTRKYMDFQSGAKGFFKRVIQHKLDLTEEPSAKKDNQSVKKKTNIDNVVSLANWRKGKIGRVWRKR